MDLRIIQHRNWHWVEQQGWHNKTPLECTALIHTEVAEASQAIRLGEPLDRIGEELADIVLRTLDLAQSMGLDMEVCILDKMEHNKHAGNKGRER